MTRLTQHVHAALAPLTEASELRRQLAERDEDNRKLGQANRLLVDQMAMWRQWLERSEQRNRELEERVDRLTEENRALREGQL